MLMSIGVHRRDGSTGTFTLLGFNLGLMLILVSDGAGDSSIGNITILFPISSMRSAYMVFRRGGGEGISKCLMR